MGLAFSSDESVLKLAGIGCIRHRGGLWHLVGETTPVAPTTKTLPIPIYPENTSTEEEGCEKNKPLREL